MRRSVFHLTISGLLTAVGIIIPVFSPIKFVLEPASFTLASHVAIFIAMFIYPGMAAALSIGTTIGFYLGAFPLVVVLRAATHVIFATGGAMYYKKYAKARFSAVASNIPAVASNGPAFTSGSSAAASGGHAVALRFFSFFIAAIHAICELAVVSAFYFYGGMGATYYEQGFFTSVLLLVGLGTVVHSMVDFEIAYVIKSALAKLTEHRALFTPEK